MKVKAIFLGLLLIFLTVSARENWKPPRDFVKAKVIRVIDGDTIIITVPKITFNNRKTLKNLKFTLRLIGVDTPESKANRRAKLQSRENKKNLETIIKLGKKAKFFTENILTVRKSGKKRKYTYVYLEFDVEPQDRYGRLLAYVWLPNGEMLNEKIICSGYAYPLTIPPNVKYKHRFLRCFKEARENRRGLWK
ncbi:thermonuclease family protein [Persephonella sp.]